MEAQDPNTVTVLAGRIADAVHELKKLAAKAERYGTPRIMWTVSAPRPEVRLDENMRKITVMVCDLKFTTLEAPKVGDYKFIARLERTEAGTIIDAIPGEELPEHFRHSTGECEHCKKARSRKDLFVVRDPAGAYVQVGRTCLRDYMGTDTPASVAARFRFLREAKEWTDDWALAGGASVPDSALELLAVTATAIRLWGWVPKSAPESAGQATAYKVSAWFYCHPSDKPAQEDRAALRAALLDADYEEAAATMAWVEEEARKEGCSEYMWNLWMVLSTGVVEPKRRGYACSAVAAHQRHLGVLELKRREREVAVLSKHVGTIGERLRGLELTVLSNRGIPSQYGECILYKMRDAEGNMFSWFKSGEGIMDVGNTYILDATVKDHVEYQGVLETQLTRAKKPGV